MTSGHPNPGEPDWAGLFDGAPCGLLQLDGGHAILRANAYAARLLARPQETLAGLRFHDLVSVAGRLFAQSRLWPELALAGRVEEIALDLIDGAGARVPVLLNATQASEEDEGPGGIRIAFTRAVAKRAYEAEVPRARREAAEAARVKSDFLANVSHELRTPLNAVVGGADALGRTALDLEQLEMVGLVQSSGEALRRIITDILEVARIEAGQLGLEPRDFDPRGELGGVMELARIRAAEKGLAFEARFGPGTACHLHGDPERIKQILSHLASNAVKFTDEGRVLVAVDIVDEGLATVLALSVEDTGIGFDDATGDALFSRFHQVEEGLSRERGGAGLGLALCKALADLMGGTIAARSRLGEGSRFTVRLPLRRVAAPIPPPPRPAMPEGSEATPGPLRVLLVEDQDANRKVVEILLSRQGMRLVAAEDGARGVEAWRGGAFDLVLMDVQMPVMDGLAAIRAIRAAERAERGGHRTPIAVLSANAMVHHRREALEAGADTHIAKPVTAKALLEGITAAMAAVGGCARRDPAPGRLPRPHRSAKSHPSGAG